MFEEIFGGSSLSAVARTQNARSTSSLDGGVSVAK